MDSGLRKGTNSALDPSLRHPYRTCWPHQTLSALYEQKLSLARPALVSVLSKTKMTFGYLHLATLC